MKLLTAGASPYGRKAKMTAIIKGLIDHIELVDTDSRPADNPDLRAKNPLSKIPALVLADGTTLYDSKVICEYLDSQVATNVLFPGDGAERWQTLTLGALGDGIMDAALLLVYEQRFRPEEKWHQDWMTRQQLKIDGAVDHLEAHIPDWGRAPGYGHLTVAAALGYLDFRHAGKWREGRPNLVAWLDRYAEAVPAFGQTTPA